MKPSAYFESVIQKAYKAHQHNADQPWDFPDYGGNLTPGEIQKLSIEQVDAIQVAMFRAAERTGGGLPTTLDQFREMTMEHYETIVPERKASVSRSAAKPR